MTTLGNAGSQASFLYIKKCLSLGRYKKIGVCGGRSIYQNMNNSDIFIYYGCGRWFIGLEVINLIIRYKGGLIKLLPGEEDDIEAMVCQLMLIKIKLFLKINH